MIIGYNQAFAQEYVPYYLVEKGAVREMASYDKKDKLTGTFTCYKMTSTIETTTMFTMVAKSTEWMARKVGPVRSET